jgi:hypothetical protein
MEFDVRVPTRAADAALLETCGNDFALMCRAKQSKLVHNRLSVRRIIETFGPLGTKIPGMLPADFVLLLEFAQNDITPPVGTDFVPQADNLPPLRQRYITLKHFVNSLLSKQWGDGTMALLETEKTKQIQGIHFSAQHQADSKGKQEGRVIGDLSGQHDPAYTPLNGTSDSKDSLRRDIAQAWGEIKHPTVVQLVLMWRSFVLLLVAHPTKLSRCMESFRPQAPQYCFKYDASLTRIAVGVYTSDSDELLTFTGKSGWYSCRHAITIQPPPTLTTHTLTMINCCSCSLYLSAMLSTSFKRHRLRYP